MKNLFHFRKVCLINSHFCLSIQKIPIINTRNQSESTHFAFWYAQPLWTIFFLLVFGCQFANDFAEIQIFDVIFRFGSVNMLEMGDKTTIPRFCCNISPNTHIQIHTHTRANIRAKSAKWERKKRNELNSRSVVASNFQNPFECWRKQQCLLTNQNCENEKKCPANTC